MESLGAELNLDHQERRERTTGPRDDAIARRVKTINNDGLGRSRLVQRSEAFPELQDSKSGGFFALGMSTRAVGDHEKTPVFRGDDERAVLVRPRADRTRSHRIGALEPVGSEYSVHGLAGVQKRERLEPLLRSSDRPTQGLRTPRGAGRYTPGDSRVLLTHILILPKFSHLVEKAAISWASALALMRGNMGCPRHLTQSLLRATHCPSLFLYAARAPPE